MRTMGKSGMRKPQSRMNAPITKTMDYLKLGLTRLTPSNLLSKCSTILSKMEGNTNFPSPVPPLPTVNTKRAELMVLTAQATDGSLTAIANRDKVYDELQAMLRKLAAYVTLMAEGRGTAILSSGFDLRKKKQPLPPLTTPQDLRARRTDYEGRVALKWNPVRGTKTSIMYISPKNYEGDDANWKMVAMTTKSKMEVSNLEFGNHYRFRVKANGTTSESPYSAVAFIRAT